MSQNESERPRYYLDPETIRFMQRISEMRVLPAGDPSWVPDLGERWREWLANVQGQPGPFAEGGAGPLHGLNGMFRPNYFNGRYLSAETLNAEQVFWDTRTRLTAQDDRAGIAWGLELALPQAWTNTPGQGASPGPVAKPRAAASPAFRSRAAVADSRVIFPGVPPRNVCSDFWQALAGLPEALDAQALATLHEQVDQWYSDLATDPNRTVDPPPRPDLVSVCLCKYYRDLLENAGEDPARVMAVKERIETILDEHDITFEEFLAVCQDAQPEPGAEPEVPGSEPQPGPQIGWSADDEVGLSPGLAFDDAGRPIVVGAPFPFTFRKLIELHKRAPYRIVSGGTAFAPCVCIEPDPHGPIDAGTALPPGPYLLVITPEERPDGEAKVYGELCTPSTKVHCQFDGWRGGFGLSLVVYPVQVNGAQLSPWDRRGILAAHYFDNYERHLAARWPAGFAQDRAFCAGPDPHLRNAGAVPLAMVYIASEGSVLFVDSWIPRRPRASSASAAWFSEMCGGPTSSAAMARLHQFQCQLADHLRSGGHPTGPPMHQPRAIPNLYQRGFRHIPPWGFLPVRPRQTAGNGQGGQDKRRIPPDPRIESACEQAEAYFAETNVLTFCTVAPYDDDILENMVRSIDKDPIALRPRPGPIDAELQKRIEWFESRLKLAEQANVQPGAMIPSGILYLILYMLARLLPFGPFSTDMLTNREIEVVQLIVPLRGRLRWRGEMQELSEAEWLLGPRAERVQERSGPFDRFIPGYDPTVPHSFVFYVKQRLVLPAPLYHWVAPLIEWLGGLIFTGLREPPKYDVTTESDTRAWGFINSHTSIGNRDLRFPYQPIDDPGYVDPVPFFRGLDDGLLRNLLGNLIVEYAMESQPDLRNAAAWEQFAIDREESTAAAEARGASPAEAARLGLYNAIERGLDEYAGFGVIKFAATSLERDELERMLGTLRERAAELDLAEEDRPLGGEVFAERPKRIGRDPSLARDLYAAARRAYGKRPLPGVPEPGVRLRLNDVLARSPADLRKQLGTEDARKLTDKVRKDGKDLVAAVKTMAESEALDSADFKAAYRESRDANPEALGDALTDLRGRVAAAERPAVDALLKLHALIETEGVEAMLERRWRD